MIIERMKEEDLDQVVEIEKDLFETDAWPRASFEYDLNNDVAELWVMKDEDVIVGYYDTYYMFDNADIGTIAISRNYQGQGLGRKLLNDLMRNCVKNGVEFLHLEVKVDNSRAIKLYESCGFETMRVIKGYYNGVDAYDMLKGLVGLSEEDFSN